MENREARIEEQRREFVEPTVSEEASLTEVTLGGLITVPDILFDESGLGGLG